MLSVRNVIWLQLRSLRARKVAVNQEVAAFHICVLANIFTVLIIHAAWFKPRSREYTKGATFMELTWQQAREL